jgi:hypothetical protein
MSGYLTIQQILDWADEFREQTGCWPNKNPEHRSTLEDDNEYRGTDSEDDKDVSE